MRGMRYMLVVLAEKVCSTADRWEWSSRTVGCGAQDRGHSLAAWSARKDSEWGTRVWR
jgi:hypothetical protein